MKLSEVDIAKVSPGIKQYIDVKKSNPDVIIFFRLGDFYEMFFEDAVNISRELELTLTSKNAGLEERIPMCGIPYHAAKLYIDKLVEKGYKVGICEQLEERGIQYVENSICITGIKRRPGDRGGRSDTDTN